MNLITKTAFLACVCLASFGYATGTELTDVKIEVKLLCPPSEELQNLIKAIPPEGSKASVSFEDWKKNFVATMEATIELVKSDKVGNAMFTAGTSEYKPENKEE